MKAELGAAVTTITGCNLTSMSTPLTFAHAHLAAGTAETEILPSFVAR